MCDIGAERCAVWRADTVVARKAYVCEECGAPIRQGAEHATISSLFDGNWSTYRAHLECDALSRRLYEDLCEGEGLYVTGMMIEHLGEAGVFPERHPDEDTRFGPSSYLNIDENDWLDFVLAWQRIREMHGAAERWA